MLIKPHRRVVSAVYYFRTKAWVTGQAAIPAYRAKAQAQHLEVRNSERIHDRFRIHRIITETSTTEQYCCTLYNLSFSDEVQQNGGGWYQYSLFSRDNDPSLVDSSPP